MSKLFCGGILLLTAFLVIFAVDFDENSKNLGFDSDWLWIGSDLKSAGKQMSKKIIDALY